MGEANEQKKRTGIWIQKKDGSEERLEGVTRLKFYGRGEKEADDYGVVFTAKQIFIDRTTPHKVEYGHTGTTISIVTEEGREENAAIKEAKRREDLAQIAHVATIEERVEAYEDEKSQRLREVLEEELEAIRKANRLGPRREGALTVEVSAAEELFRSYAQQRHKLED